MRTQGSGPRERPDVAQPLGSAPGVLELVPGPTPVVLHVGVVHPEVSACLARLGCRELVSESFAAAEYLAPSVGIDLVLADAATLVGEDALRLVRVTRDPGRSTEVLLLGDVSVLGSEVLVKAMRAGFADVLNPADTIALHTTVEAALQTRRRRAERVLAVGAHPDDVEIGCAGTLLEHRRTGDEVSVLTLSHGAVGGTAEDRVGESAQAALLMGARLLLADLPDTQIDPGVETIRLVEAVVRDVDPTVVYVHSPHDHHQDHRAVHTATMSATRGIPQVFCYQSPSASNQFFPTRFAPIDAVLQNKVEVLGSFASQSERAYLEPELVVAGARYWARQLAPRSRYAEPFEVIRSFTGRGPESPPAERPGAQQAVPAGSEAGA